ncbi:MAG: S-layer homology domain-containing protein [Candidatus Margulisbacteria bacterium]|nr:S-layer homology domain-containing protein [Candidatus Margulisiibacteriota bacterium]
MKKILTFLLVFTSLLFPVLKFKDVPNNYWGQAYLQEVMDMGVMTGYTDNTFRGEKTISRYDLAIVLAKYDRYIQNKLNLVLVKAGEQNDNNEDYLISQAATSKAETANKETDNEAIEDDIYDLKNDVKFLQQKIDSLKQKNTADFRFSLFHHTILNSNANDVFANNAKLSYQNDFLKFNILLSDVTANSNSTDLEIAMNGDLPLPFINNIGFSVSKGPGERINRYNEVVNGLSDRINLYTSFYMPLDLGLQFGSNNQNIFSLSSSFGFNMMEYGVELIWVKKYLFQDRLANLIKSNGILANKDLFTFNIKYKDTTFKSKWKLSSSPDNYYYIELRGSNVSFIDFYTIKLLSLGDNAYDTRFSDKYTDLGAVDTFMAPVENNSNYFSVRFEKIIEKLEGYTELSSKELNSINYYQANIGCYIPYNEIMKFQYEARYSTNSTNVRNFGILFGILLNI